MEICMEMERRMGQRGILSLNLQVSIGEFSYLCPSVTSWVNYCGNIVWPSTAGLCLILA